MGYIAYRGVNGTTAVNMAINVIQISALMVFAVMAIAYRTSHTDGSLGWHLSNGTPVDYNVAQVNVTDDKNKPVQDTWADNSPKFQQDANGKDIVGADGKPVLAIKQQDRQVAADDLDKAKNTNAVELASLTALKLGVGDPYPAWKADDKGNPIVKDGVETPDPFILSYKPADCRQRSGNRARIQPRSITTRAPHLW